MITPRARGQVYSGRKTPQSAALLGDFPAIAFDRCDQAKIIQDRRMEFMGQGLYITRKTRTVLPNLLQLVSK